MCSNSDYTSCDTHVETIVDAQMSKGRTGTENVRTTRFYLSRPGNLPDGRRNEDLESVYSCDSDIERIDDEDDDSDPYDRRTKVYLDEHLEEMGYPGKDPLQLYADSKIAEVLARGTITEQKRRENIRKLKKALPNRRITTPDFSEAKKIIEEIESALEKQREFTSVTDAYESIKAMIESEFNEENVQFDDTGPSVAGFNGVVEVRRLAMEFLRSDLDEEDEQLDDDCKNFAGFVSSRMVFPQSSILESTGRPLTERSEENQAQFNVKSELNGPDNLKEKKCPKHPGFEGETITTKRMILMFKKQIYKVFHNHVTMMRNSKNLMIFELFRIWNKNQDQGLVEMAQDIVRREHDLRVSVNKVIQSKRMETMRAAKLRRDASHPVLVPEKPGLKSMSYVQQFTHEASLNEAEFRSLLLAGYETPATENDISGRAKKAVDCIRKREKLLRAKQDMFFLSGVLNGKIKCKPTLSKVWYKAPVGPGAPPRPPRGNNRVINVLEKCRESNKRVITYGDMVRLLQQDGEFCVFENPEEDAGDSSVQTGAIKEGSISGEILTSFVNEESERECPLVTKREYEDYLKIMNELFFPDPDFKHIKETISFSSNAFACERPLSLSMNYSLDQLEHDTEKVFGFHGHLARVVYFFHYKSEYAAVDVQDAYERYVYENNAMDHKSQQHPFGCLLLYSNVAQGIVMIEGPILHVFNHFSGFRHSQIHPMIQTGRILYVREKVSRHYFRKWVSIVVAPSLGKLTYLTSTKKILNRVAEPRLFHFMEKLDRFYRIMSQNKMEETYLNIGENGMFMAPNPLLLFESCCCHTKKEDIRKKELHVPVMDLLPSPALVSYLLKYRSLKSFNRFLDEIFTQPELESEDETYNIVENTVLSNYVESDDEENTPKITKEIKRLCREKEILGKLRKELNDNMVKDTKGKDPPEWTKEYDIHNFNPQLVKVQVRPKGGFDVIKIDDLADTEEEGKREDEERFLRISYENNKFEAQRRFVNFIQTGSEAWQKKIKRFQLRGRAVTEMLQDAINYKKLRKIMQVLENQRATDSEEVCGVEEAVPEEMEEEEEEAELINEEERDSVDGDIRWASAVEELKKVLEQEETGECMGEQMEWPFPLALEQLGEGYPFLEEGNFDEFHGEHKFDWNSKSDSGKPIDRLDGDEKSILQSGGSVTTDRTVENQEEEESMPQAPPTSYVSHSSTDP